MVWETDPEVGLFSSMSSSPEYQTLPLHRGSSNYLLKIADNSIGIPAGIDVKSSNSLVLFLIRFIVKHQLCGTLEISTDGGTARWISLVQKKNLKKE
jgi:two-component sensor histidine kinase